MLTAAELAREFSVSRQTVYRWAAKGQVPTVRLGGTLRIPVKPLVDRLRRNSSARRMQ
ncbi:MAG TPA: helix-turn-helix domain-containing protein [Gaiellaceae bacterium]|nr:helix-turn-helix domain-containing protein [Gaiellaceae bacterium]